MTRNALSGADNRLQTRRIVVSLLKGGVAKSETAVHLAHGLALAGQKILLVDTDIQAQCSDMLGLEPERGLAELIAGVVTPEDAPVEARPNLDLLAGGVALAGVKMEIARREMSPEAVLAEALEPYEGRYDAIVMDTAPGWDAMLVNALYCSREVLSPVSMEPMAVKGLDRFQERLGIIQKYNRELKIRWIIPTFVDGRVRKTETILNQLNSRYGDLIGPAISYSAKLSEATAFGKTIFEHDPKGVGAKTYLAMIERVIADDPRPVEARSPVRSVRRAAAELARSLRQPIKPVVRPTPEPVIAPIPEPLIAPAAVPAVAAAPVIAPASETVPLAAAQPEAVGRPEAIASIPEASAPQPISSDRAAAGSESTERLEPEPAPDEPTVFEAEPDPPLNPLRRLKEIRRSQTSAVNFKGRPLTQLKQRIFGHGRA